MGEINKNYKVKLVCGVLFNPGWFKENFHTGEGLDIPKYINKIVEENLARLLKCDVKIDLQTELIKFNFTDYYNEEMGDEILRYWISFEPLIVLDSPYKIKLLTNQIEQECFSDEKGNRKVNIDPGYVEGSKLVLFSTKNYSHRIYLGKGIFAEVTLIYKHGKFEFLPWTYPDYKTDLAVDFFLKVRNVWCKEQNC